MRSAWASVWSVGLAVWLAGLGAWAEDGAGPPPPAPLEPADPKAPVVPGPPPELVSERPTMSASSQVAPAGFALFELGLGYHVGEDTQLLTLPRLLVRYGLGGGGEVRVGFAGLEATFPDTGPGEVEMGPLSLGGKYTFSLGESFDVGLLGMVGLPLRGEAYDSKGVSLALALTGEVELADWVDARANFGVDVLGLGAGSSAQDRIYLVSLALGFEAGERTRLFLEGYGQIPELAQDDARAVLQVGFAFRPVPHWQVDGSLGLDLLRAPDAVSAGLGSTILW
ncbi:MAG TPA: hypothetical protein PK668_09175 [Myxococcota bacterium]|nr:hypothetical protein [Myxococcota bacterium]HRY92848.1 hypothetical protein [Myxococcota bacterium]HSA20293.1 hypothetical protein [Myxococcota bacterium]